MFASLELSRYAPIPSASQRSGAFAGGPLWKPDNHGTFIELAERTGGKAYYNRNDIDGAVREVFADSKVTYTLAYYPAEPQTKQTFREIKVKVNRPGTSLRHRKGYFSLSDLPAEDARAIEAELRTAVWSPLDATAVAMNARVDLVESGKQFSVYTQIDPATISLKQSGDRWQGRVDVVFVQKTAEGRVVASASDVLTFNFSKAEYSRVLKEGVIYQRDFAARPDAKVMRVVARDAPSGLAGSITVPLDRVVAK
jgi:hypothetical protein